VKLPQSLKLDKHGNPTKKRYKFCTICPVTAMEFKQRFEGKELRMFQKWSEPQKKFSDVNVGKPAELAIEWLAVQGVTAGAGNTFDTNGGRQALAAWLQECSVPYHEGFEIHGDLFDVWSTHYQLNCVNPNNFCRRTQSADPYVCTAALRRLRYWFGREKKIETAGMTPEMQLLSAFVQSQGQSDLVLAVLKKNGM
jgi:hypothetical protein